MAYRDLYSEIRNITAIAPAILTATATGAALDMRPNRRVCYIVNTGANVGSAVFGARLQESNDGTTWTDVPAAQMDSNVPAILTANGNWRMGYRGSRRFVRPVVPYTSGTSLAVAVSAIVDPIEKPVL